MTVQERQQAEVNSSNAHQFVTLRDYIDAQVCALVQVMTTRIDAIEHATSLAAGVMDKRLDGMNHFITQQRDDRTTLSSRHELQMHMDKNESDVKRLDALVAKADKQFGTLIGFLVGSGVLGGAIGATLAKLL